MISTDDLRIGLLTEPRSVFWTDEISVSTAIRLIALADCDLNLPLYRIAVCAKAAMDMLVVSPSGLPLRLGALPFALTALAVKQTDSGADRSQNGVRST
ncbi:hypothetical protein [Lactococcus protaetiae]|uniref:Uncharacterized protein n=1 Tax=Lactococcus protaetiae TaxID=2592653 RepID=A0A514ZAJ7_9LACT|nr:hypothetical protein [Lactococcus protaetiae]QDK71603.1 hypothetical protein FLP15_11050 [Lactococcus protaetiae]